MDVLNTIMQWAVAPIAVFVIWWAAGVAVEVIKWAVPATGQPSLEDIVYTGVGACAACAWILTMGS